MKPRSVALEFLFLDSRSPLKALQNYFGFSSQKSVTTKGPWLGEASAIASVALELSHLKNADRSYAKYSGGLIALTTLLGLVDLHSENILEHLKSNGELIPVPVDLEIAFWDCVSGMDTLLFPSIKADKFKAGLAGVSKQPYLPVDPSVLLDSFLSTCAAIEPDFTDILETLEQEMKDQPIRILLRPTSEYRAILDGSAKDPKVIPLLDEERIQLAAGDIPYFFTTRDLNPELLYFSAPSVIERCLPLHLQSKLVAGSRSVEYLASKTRVSRLIQITALHLCRAYAECFSKPECSGEKFELSWKADGEFELRTAFFSARARS